MVRVELEGIVKDVAEGRLRGQLIAEAHLNNEIVLKFDVIKGVMDVDKEDRIRVLITDEDLGSEDIDNADFCGHGYLVESEDIVGKTILSLWGIIFMFNKKLGLIPNRKYYLCIMKS